MYNPEQFERHPVLPRGQEQHRTKTNEVGHWFCKNCRLLLCAPIISFVCWILGLWLLPDILDQNKIVSTTPPAPENKYCARGTLHDVCIDKGVVRLQFGSGWDRPVWFEFACPELDASMLADLKLGLGGYIIVAYTPDKHKKRMTAYTRYALNGEYYTLQRAWSKP